MQQRDPSLVFDQFPILNLAKINLRQIVKADAQDYYNFITHEGVTKYLSDQDIPKDLAGAEEEVAYWSGLFPQRRSIYWAVVTKDTDKLIGTCGFNNWSRVNARAEISYDISHDYWNQGIATEAVTAISNFALDVMLVNRVQATVVFDNVASMRVLEKSGYVREGKLANYYVLRGKVMDGFMYSKVR